MDIQGFDCRVDETPEPPTAANRPGIAGGSRKYVSFKPLLGLFNQEEFLPLKLCPNTIEFELVSNALDAIYTAGGGGPFAAADTSQLWSIENPRLNATSAP